MADKIYIVEGRQFKTENEQKQALRDQNLIEKLRERIKGGEIDALKEIKQGIESGSIKFLTILGEDFIDELDEGIRKASRSTKRTIGEEGRNISSKATGRTAAGRDSERATGRTAAGRDSERTFERRSSDGSKIGSMTREDEIETEAKRILRRREKRRRLILIICAVIAVMSIGVFIFYMISDHNNPNKVFNKIREKSLSETAAQSSAGGNKKPNQTAGEDVVINYTTGTNKIPEVVLPEFEEMLQMNSKLIGWLTIEDTVINYPVAQTVDNEYYLNHDLNQKNDRNGTIFLDCNCDVLKPSTNFILYGHHMQSGKMFGGLVKYESEDYYKKHKYITFDTIYEHGTYEVMYVFRSHVYGESEIAFKYYQFYDAYSEVEFDSYMKEMAEMSLYDTGLTAGFGDRLLTLSTCDYQEENGRFVVVAKKID